MDILNRLRNLEDRLRDLEALIGHEVEKIEYEDIDDDEYDYSPAKKPEKRPKSKSGKWVIRATAKGKRPKYFTDADDDLESCWVYDVAEATHYSEAKAKDDCDIGLPEGYSGAEAVPLADCFPIKKRHLQ